MAESVAPGSDALVAEESQPPEYAMDAGALSYALTESICGPDERIKITDTTVSPYFWICRLDLEFEEGQAVGSGWLAATGSSKWDVVVTSGHCVFSGPGVGSTGGFAKSVTVVPGAKLSAPTAPYGTYKVSTENLRASAKWQSSGAAESTSDYGAVLIPKTGKLAALQMSIAKDDELQGRTILNAGYPGDVRPYGELYEMAGPISAFNAQMLQYMNDTFGGQSGSPTLALKDGGTSFQNFQDVVAVGIHGYGGCPNKSVRLTDTVVNDILAWSTS